MQKGWSALLSLWNKAKQQRSSELAIFKPLPQNGCLLRVQLTLVNCGRHNLKAGRASLSIPFIYATVERRLFGLPVPRRVASRRRNR